MDNQEQLHVISVETRDIYNFARKSSEEMLAHTSAKPQYKDRTAHAAMLYRIFHDDPDRTFDFTNYTFFALLPYLPEECEEFCSQLVHDAVIETTEVDTCMHHHCCRITTFIMFRIIGQWATYFYQFCQEHPGHESDVKDAESFIEPSVVAWRDNVEGIKDHIRKSTRRFAERYVTLYGGLRN